MKIDIQMQKRSLKMSEPINIKCCDNNINSVSDVLNLQTIKVEEITKTAFSEKSDIKIEKLIQSQNIERVYLNESESMIHEYTESKLGTNLDESLNDQSEKAYCNMTPYIKIDVPLEEHLLKLSESINVKCSDNNINSVSDVLNLKKIKVVEITKT